MDNHPRGSDQEIDESARIRALVSQAQLKGIDVDELRQIFESMDTDHNGVLTSAELLESLRRMGLPHSRSTVEDMMDAADTSGDGSITFLEFVHFVWQREQKMRRVFARFDTSGDGRICLDDLSKVVQRLGHEAKKTELQSMLHNVHETDDVPFTETAETHASGRVTYEELRRMMFLLPTISAEDIFDHWHSAIVDIEDPLPDEPEKTGNLKTLVAGGIAGAVSRTLTAPIDRVKVLLQAGNACTSSEVRKDPNAAPIRGFYHGLRTIYRTAGLRGFFVGNGTNCIKIAPETAARFWAYDRFKRIICRDHEAPTLFERFCSGASAGAVAQFCIYPLEIVKTRLAVSRVGEYKGILDCARRTVKFEGRTALFKGMGASLTGIVPYAGVELAVFHTIKQMYTERRPGVEPSVPVLMATGGISSACGQMLAYPLQLARTKLQAQGMRGRPVLYEGPFDCLRKVCSQDGFVGMYRGIGPNFAKSIPAIAISYTVFEKVKRILPD